jgi:PAS domain S-box-containing protein
MTVERRIRITAGVLIFFVFVTGLFLFWSSRLVEKGIRGIDSTSQAVRTTLMMTILFEQHLLYGDERSLKEWDKHREILGRTLDEMISESINQELFANLRNKYLEVGSLSPHIGKMASIESNDERQNRRTRDLLTSIMLLRLERLADAANELSRATQTLTMERRQFVDEIIVAIGALMVIVIFINMYLIRRSVVNPLTALSAGAERIGQGNFDYVAETKSDDEVGKLAKAFNIMIERIQQRTNALRKAKDELEIRVQERTAELESAKESILADRQRLRDILETLPAVVSLLAPDHRIAFANRTFRERYGEGSGRHCFEACFGLKEPCEFCETYSVLETGRPHRWEYMAPDASSFSDVNAFPFRDVDGSPLILEVSVDITEQRRAEEALLAASAYNRSLIESSLDPLVTISAEGKITDVNMATEMVTGHPRDQLIGKQFVDYFSDPEKARSGYETVLRDGTVRDYELEIKNEDGMLTPVLYNASIYRDASGKAVGIFAAARDISERKRAEEELIRSNELLNEEIAERMRAEKDRDRFFNLSSDMLCFGGFDGYFKRINPAFSKTLGWSAEELLSKQWIEFVHPDDREETDSAKEQLASGNNLYSFENRYKCKDGSYRWLWWNSFPLRDENLMFAIARDITERKYMEEELIRSNKDLQQFAYVASHDLQEPLRNVATCLQMLEKHYKNKLGADADRYIQYAVDASVRMKGLILDLLEYSRVATRREPQKLVNCEKTLGQCMKNLKAAVSESGAKITHDPLPSIFGNYSQLLRVLQNLIQNAIKFRGDDQPQIHISAVKDKNEWTFSVKDNGIGIEFRYLDRIFVIFQRLHSMDEYDGTGMGLAIVKKIIERHGGRIWAESEPGMGTTFFFTLPEKGLRK